MRNKTIGRTIWLSSLVACSVITNSFADGFTVGKNKYEFTAEYEGVATEINTKGVITESRGNSIELNNEFGITKDTSLILDLFYGRSKVFADSTDNNNKLSDNYGFQMRHLMNFRYNDDINFGLQTAVKFSDDKDGTYADRYEIKGMVRHDKKSGFYSHSRLEIAYRQRFKEEDTNALIFDIRTKFRLTDKVQFLVRVMPSFTFTNKNYRNAQDDDYKKSVNANLFNGSGSIKLAQTKLFVGPEFSLPKNQTVYVYIYSQIQAAPKYKDSGKGIVVGYTKGFGE